MILGIGSDIVQIPRIERLEEKFGRKFLERILSEKELEVFDHNHCRAFVARRFAGKEAVAKALGLGIGRPLKFNDISITNDNLGKPQVQINWSSYQELISWGDKKLQFDITLSDDYPLAIAFAVVSCYNFNAK